MFTSIRPHRDDVALAVSGLLGGVLLWLLGLHTQGGRPFSAPWITLVPLTVMAAMELLRRSAPRTALIVGTLALIADQFTRGSLATILMFTDVMYAAVLYGTPAAARRIPVATLLITVASTIGFLAWFRTPEALLIGVVTGLISFIPAITGVSVRNHRTAAEAARLAARQTARLAEMDRTQAVIAERARMARELHDMVANHLSAVAIHSTAALSIDDPETSRRALKVIRENSVEGLAEMRRLIGLLREGGEDGAPAAAPTLASLDALVEQANGNGASSGLVCVLEDTRAEAAVPLPTPVELAAYRIVQESLTNALKHAAPGPVTVRLDLAGEVLTVEVTSAFGSRPGPTAPGSGAGLVGMRERVALLGGTFGAGAEADGDGTKIWRVRAELPATEGTMRK
ncbi:sensor histidine kinase [Streptomyces microflavus]|uniref:histidine kinase n=1 Tax=Streptomyces microflavus TaxID=1919 RepID=A0A6N9V4Y6_STRMI|nr:MULTISPECIES: histidine kinase [Streptomyces]MBK5990738.1 two-component sensor histidine kinase [Streptomyces sp. MBT58]NEB67954.1 two-component sensor histidine kinase [Streptomyces microflavus]QQZ56507.1 two-component sensor histidine kinase [Streptomyces microflavus]QTA34792.1 two-component sensor histidine kinase [Streptomyces sp. CA-256286]